MSARVVTTEAPVDLATRLQPPSHCCLLSTNNMQLQQLVQRPSCLKTAMIPIVLRNSSSPHWLVGMSKA